MLKVKILILLADKIKNIWSLGSLKNMHIEGHKIFAIKWEDGILCVKVSKLIWIIGDPILVRKTSACVWCFAGSSVRTAVLCFVCFLTNCVNYWGE